MPTVFRDASVPAVSQYLSLAAWRVCAREMEDRCAQRRRDRPAHREATALRCQDRPARGGHVHGWLIGHDLAPEVVVAQHFAVVRGVDHDGVVENRPDRRGIRGSYPSARRCSRSWPRSWPGWRCAAPHRTRSRRPAAAGRPQAQRDCIDAVTSIGSWGPLKFTCRNHGASFDADFQQLQPVGGDPVIAVGEIRQRRGCRVGVVGAVLSGASRRSPRGGCRASRACGETPGTARCDPFLWPATKSCLPALSMPSVNPRRWRSASGSVAVASVLSPIHRSLQEIEFAAAEHPVAGIAQRLVEVGVVGVHVVLVGFHGLGVVGRYRSQAPARR